MRDSTFLVSFVLIMAAFWLGIWLGRFELNMNLEACAERNNVQRCRFDTFPIYKPYEKERTPHG